MSSDKLDLPIAQNLRVGDVVSFDFAYLGGREKAHYLIHDLTDGVVTNSLYDQDRRESHGSKFRNNFASWDRVVEKNSGRFESRAPLPNDPNVPYAANVTVGDLVESRDGAFRVLSECQDGQLEYICESFGGKASLFPTRVSIHADIWDTWVARQNVKFISRPAKLAKPKKVAIADFARSDTVKEAGALVGKMAADAYDQGYETGAATVLALAASVETTDHYFLLNLTQAVSANRLK